MFTATNALLGVCLAAHAAAIVYPGIRKQGSFYLPNILKGEVWRLATSLVLHHGVLHLLLNMHALYKEGPKIEKNWGARGFAQIAAMATATEVIAASIVSPNMNALGLSGVLFGMQGALVAYSLKGNRKDISHVFKKTGSFIFKEYIITQIMRNALGINISLVSHVSGFIGGMLFGWLSNSSPALQTDESLKVRRKKAIITLPEPLTG